MNRGGGDVLRQQIADWIEFDPRAAHLREGLRAAGDALQPSDIILLYNGTDHYDSLVWGPSPA